MIKRIFFSFSLILLFCSFVFAKDWNPIDRVLYKGTTDNPINFSWGAVDGKKLVMIRYIYNTNNSDSVVYNVYDGDNLKLSNLFKQKFVILKQKPFSVLLLFVTISISSK